MTGSGKTHSAIVITEELLKHEIPVVVIDATGECRLLTESIGAKSDRYLGQVVTIGRELRIDASGLGASALRDLLNLTEVQEDILAEAIEELRQSLVPVTLQRLADFVSAKRGFTPLRGIR